MFSKRLSHLIHLGMLAVLIVANTARETDAYSVAETACMEDK